MRLTKRLASSRELIAEETGRNPDDAQIGIAFVGKRSYALGAFADDLTLIPVRATVPVRRLPDADVLTLPWSTLRIIKGRTGFAYSSFEIAAPSVSLRVYVARPWRDLIEELNARAESEQV